MPAVAWRAWPDGRLPDASRPGGSGSYVRWTACAGPPTRGRRLGTGGIETRIISIHCHAD